MSMGEQILCPVRDRSQVGEARRRITALSGSVELGPVAQQRLGLIVSELATNLVKHGGGGDLIARAVPRPRALELLALDKGPGMASVEECLRDGHSTAGSAGTGLGAVRRLASALDVYSSRPGGTAILARVVAADAPGGPPSPWDVGAVRLPKAGEEACGDAWTAMETDDGYCVFVADGLGHGPGAADAAHAAVRCVQTASAAIGPGAQISAVHLALRATRGAAVAMARVLRRTGVVVFAGVGNIAAAIVDSGRARSLVSLNGTAGHSVHRIAEFTYPWTAGAVLVLHTDGLSGRWDLARYPGLAERDPAVVAGVLFRDFNRGRDDATVVAVRERVA